MNRSKHKLHAWSQLKTHSQAACDPVSYWRIMYFKPLMTKMQLFYFFMDAEQECINVKLISTFCWQLDLLVCVYKAGRRNAWSSPVGKPHSTPSHQVCIYIMWPTQWTKSILQHSKDKYLRSNKAERHYSQSFHVVLKYSVKMYLFLIKCMNQVFIPKLDLMQKSFKPSYTLFVQMVIVKC